MRARAHTHTYTHSRTHTRTRTHAHTHTHTHTHNEHARAKRTHAQNAHQIPYASSKPHISDPRAHHSQTKSNHTFRTSSLLLFSTKQSMYCYGALAWHRAPVTPSLGSIKLVVQSSLLCGAESDLPSDVDRFLIFKKIKKRQIIMHR